VGGTSIDPNDIVDEEGEPGTCRFCGCTEGRACVDGCSWANEEETICNSQQCLARFRAEIGEDPNAGFQKTYTSVAELRKRIESQSLRVLSGAPFPLDGDLAPMPCTSCPKRSTNSALLFDDCAQDTCTDRRCYDAKVGAWIQAELERAKAGKRKLLKLTQSWTNDKARVEVSDYRGAKLVNAEHECDSEEEGIWIDSDNIGRRAIVCRNQNCAKHHVRHSSGGSVSVRPKQSEQEKEKRRKLLDKVKETKAYRAALVAKIAEASPAAKALEALQIDVCCAVIAKTNSLYAAHLAKAIGWDESLLSWNKRSILRARVMDLSTAKRFLIARLCEEAGELSVNEYNATGKAEDLEKLAQAVGVDSKKLRAAPAVVKPGKVAAAKAVKPAKKKAVLSASARKRIAEAQRKRWAAAAKKKGGR
jgi:hypothetical protein